MLYSQNIYEQKTILPLQEVFCLGNSKDNPLKLFDDITRDDFGTASYAESNFSYLNRTARNEFSKIRIILDEWFFRYPLTEQADLRGRFRSELNNHHQAAFFELFLHELLIRFDCQITLHPKIVETSKVPDFFVKPPNGNSFYMEATVATNESASESAAHARENAVYDAIDRLVISPNFFLWLVVDGTPNTPPPAKTLANYINSQLANLDPDKITEQYNTSKNNELPEWKFEHDGWKIKIRPTPKKPEARGKPNVRPIGARSTGFRSLNYQASIKDSLINKAARYGNLDLPYIVAVNATEPVDTTDIMEALFGKEQLSYYISDDGNPLSDPVMTRKPDGAWNGVNGPQYTRVSAVLIASRLSPWNIPRTNICLYHNPWAKKKYESILTQLPQAIPENNQMTWKSGETANEIFKLSPTWPEDEN